MNSYADNALGIKNFTGLKNRNAQIFYPCVKQGLNRINDYFHT